jgi:hypothetical protein
MNRRLRWLDTPGTGSAMESTSHFRAPNICKDESSEGGECHGGKTCAFNPEIHWVVVGQRRGRCPGREHLDLPRTDPIGI